MYGPRMYMSQQQMPQQAPWPIQIPIQGHTSVDGDHSAPESPPADADDPAYADQKTGFLQQVQSRLEAVVQLEELRDKVVIDEYTKTKAYTNAARYAAVKQSAKTSLQKEAIVRVAFVEYEEGGGVALGGASSTSPAAPATSSTAPAASSASSRTTSASSSAAAAAIAAATPGSAVSTPKPKKRSKAVSKTSAAASAAAAGVSSKESSPAPKPKTKKQLQAEQREKDRELREENAAAKEAAAAAKQLDQAYDSIWKDMARRDAAKVHKTVAATIAVKQSNHRKTAVLASKEARRWQYRTNKSIKDMQGKARRAMREMLSFWKRNEKEERDLRKKAEKEALDQAKKDEEDRESKRQARKLNFLLTQTELYSHFIGRKIKTDEMEDNEAAKDGDEDYEAMEKIATSGNEVETKRAAELDFDEDDDDKLRQIAMQNAHNQVRRNQREAQAFDAQAEANAAATDNAADSDDAFQNPTSLGDLQLSQPKLLNCTLKEYQLKGLNWLANLYEQGINGILADEMGLGKTVQSISVMAYLAETHNIWGPYLVIAPASTLHNWQQEIAKFVPDFKVLPYWGNGKDRKILRKFWDRKNVKYTRDSPFHVLVTSYQLVVSDAQYFSRVKWQYMILDEAQAIKSSSSSRWKSLLAFQCRNRLLLTGTPIQNSMQELWALLHFIMPSLFDSHDEFSEWFSKDIESHAKEKSQLDQQQLKRLHMILKPFMLRRVKKHVQQELGDKIEIDVYCNLTTRQRVMYKILKSQINLQELLAKAQSGSEENTQSLMNLVMQFRKVCNHPDLFERADVKSAYNFGPSNCGSDKDTWIGSSNRNLIKFEVPKVVYREGGFLDVPGEDSKAGGLNKLLKVDLNIWEPSWMNRKRDLVVEEEGGVGRVSRVSQMGVLDRVIREVSGEKPEEVSGTGALPRYTPVTSPFDITETLYDSYLHRLEPAYDPRVVAPPVDFVCRDRGFQIEQEEKMDGMEVRRALTPLTLGQELWWLEKAEAEAEATANNTALTPASVALPPNDLFPNRVLDFNGVNTLRMPSMSKFISCSGKLAKLDELLAELKAGDHRVLVYFQMTKMMDLAEEYLTFKQYNYCRLDGSSKLSDRRDLVNDWQTKPELFVFLLSTRAGGLGINLTAADTVIFYDSDWNPTIDSQAMDRAHRLGQTRQVTVYRLLVKGTIEERMRDRAKQKEHVQNVVMSGQSQNHEEEVSSKPSRDVALWLLDDDQDEASFVKGKENRGVKRGPEGEEEKKIEEIKKPKTA